MRGIVGLYYAIGSALTGWRPNPNKYATATRLEGPWSEFKDIAPPDTNTYGSQSTLMLKVSRQQDDERHFHGRPVAARSAMGFAIPVDAADHRRGSLSLPAPRPWTLDVATGEAVILP